MSDEVIALYVTFFIGVARFGNLAGGWLAERIGVHATLTIFGIALAFCVSLFGAGYARWHASLLRHSMQRLHANETGRRRPVERHGARAEIRHACRSHARP